MTTFGVLQFPGSCDDRDALSACRRVGEARLIWHEERDLGEIDAVVVPGGFSYGDYLRAGAIARFAPVMERGDGLRPATAGRCSGSATASRSSARRGCCPGRCCRNEGLRFVCRQVDLVAETADGPECPFTRGIDAGTTLSIPVKHTTGLYYAPEDQLDRLEAGGQIAFRYAAGHNPNGSARDIAGVTNEAGNVLGLMPHPEHAVDPLTGSEDGLRLFASIAAVPA